MAALYAKDPEAVLDYYVNWAAWLGDDTIVTSTWAVDTASDVDLGDPIDLGPLQGIWVSGGTVHTTALLTNHILTAAGREDERTILLVIKEH